MAPFQIQQASVKRKHSLSDGLIQGAAQRQSQLGVLGRQDHFLSRKRPGPRREQTEEAGMVSDGCELLDEVTSLCSV